MLVGVEVVVPQALESLLLVITVEVVMRENRAKEILPRIR